MRLLIIYYSYVFRGRQKSGARSREQLCLSAKAYWWTGNEESSSKTSTKRLRIPQQQRLSIHAISNMLSEVSTMIDASLSRSAATQVSGTAIVNYLEQSGWTVSPSKIAGILISRLTRSTKSKIFFVVPLDDNIVDSVERRADALRTIASVENRPIDRVVQSINSKLHSTPATTEGFGRQKRGNK
jgi:dihydroxyacetone kinase-like predicted kinase